MIVRVDGLYVNGCMGVDPEAQAVQVQESQRDSNGRAFTPRWAIVKSPVEFRDRFPHEVPDLADGIWWDATLGWVTRQSIALPIPREVVRTGVAE